MIRPEVQAEIDATRAAMARLRLAVTRAAPAMRKPPKSAEQVAAAAQVRALDDAYAAATGVVLDEKTAPPFPKAHIQSCYDPSVHICHFAFPRRVFAALARLRAGQQGCQPQTEYAIRVYFASIWPAPAPWPDGVEYPHIPRNKEAYR